MKAIAIRRRTTTRLYQEGGCCTFRDGDRRLLVLGGRGSARSRPDRRRSRRGTSATAPRTPRAGATTCGLPCWPPNVRWTRATSARCWPSSSRSRATTSTRPVPNLGQVARDQIARELSLLGPLADMGVDWLLSPPRSDGRTFDEHLARGPHRAAARSLVPRPGRPPRAARFRAALRRVDPRGQARGPQPGAHRRIDAGVGGLGPAGRAPAGGTPPDGAGSAVHPRRRPEVGHREAVRPRRGLRAAPVPLRRLQRRPVRLPATRRSSASWPR